MEQLEEFKLEDEPAPTNAAPDASKEERRAKKQRAKGREKDAGRSMRA